ncbi:copper radical oxidase [Hebeloma cylindrosporum]|uniref:Copper radical oxidase n=1 Tax=Hebeloma cylindrosporum TaxID=76867 RepID=A0A0C3C3C3_HEBCY|nr:copper radical oxidase [Hebeloma cylindrosporum h7]
MLISSRLSFAALSLASASSSVLAATGGSFEDGGNTLISAMMMFLGNDKSVYILDKAEGNAAQVKGHPAWGALWDPATRSAVVMDIKTNSFCASGMHLPNGSFITFGGNDGVGPTGAAGSQKNPDGTGAWDSVYQDFDGRRAIRILNPCNPGDDLTSAQCGWYDEPTLLSMKARRWYSAAEPTGDGSIVILGGFVNGGFINRWWPNTDPVTSNGQAENTYEYFPARSGDPQLVQFLVKTSGLNAYAHTFLMPSGKILVQANVSTMLWDHQGNVETPLPDMPKHIARVYPASGAVAMLPLTPDNNYTPTVLFCGGTDIPDDQWGGYGGPLVDPWLIPASKDCQRLTPEPADGSTVAYEQDDDMLEGRTMGQFILLPDGTALVINGGVNGTAAYSMGTVNTPLGFMPAGPSLSTGPVLTPAIYNPKAPKGSRWSNAGLSASKIPRLYHSSAILLPDASVLLAGSNPHPDVNLTALYPTTYDADIFYPPYFSASVRPAPTGMPTTLSYGGDPFNITIPKSSYTGLANDAAGNATVVIQRGGFTTHAMNMGQRLMQLKNTYTVNKDGTITLHVAQPPPNPNLFQPGPALMFVNIQGIPSNGSYLIVGNGIIGTQPTAAESVLPASVRLDSVTGGSSDGSNSSSTSSEKKSNSGLIIGVAAGAGALLLLLGAIAAFFISRRKKAARIPAKNVYVPGTAGAAAGLPMATWAAQRDNDSSIFTPLAKKPGAYTDDAWDPSTASLNAPYKDDAGYRSSLAESSVGNRSQMDEYDPYSQSGFPTQSHGVPPGPGRPVVSQAGFGYRDT